MKGLMDMKRKIIIPASLALMLVLTIFISPLQTLALDFLSIFRVNDIKTIEITIADLEEGMQTISYLKKDFMEQEVEHNPPINIVSQTQHEVKQLAEVEEFDAFRLHLPRDLASQKPEISAVDSSKVTFMLDVDAFNELLKALNSPKQLSGSLKDVEMTMVFSAAVYAKYDDVLFLATQKSYLDAPEAAKKELRDVMLNLPIIPVNLRKQLEEIEQDSSDIYLPVLAGLGSEVDLGGKKGYVYSMADLKALTEITSQDMSQQGIHGKPLNSLTSELQEAVKDEIAQKNIIKYGGEKISALKDAQQNVIEKLPDLENASLLVWTKNGNFYGLIGNKPDTELVKIARSVR